MAAHVAHSFPSRIKSSDQNEAMNLNQNEIIITLRIYLSDNCLWATSGLQTKVAQW